MANAFQIDLLKQIYRHWVLHDEPIPISKLRYIKTKDEFENEMKLLEISELVIIEGSRCSVSEAGRSKFKVVLTGGAYDLLHKGHVITLKEAASHGDFLIVVVARDVTVEIKKRKPIHLDIDRAYLLNSLCVVDAAVIGDKKDHMRIVRRIKPDVVAIGSDQDHLEDVLNVQLKDQGMIATEIVRLKADYEDKATTKLIENILSRSKE